jgi:hypothetical protein
LPEYHGPSFSNPSPFENPLFRRTLIAVATAPHAQNIMRRPQKSKMGGHSQQAMIQPEAPGTQNPRSLSQEMVQEKTGVALE